MKRITGRVRATDVEIIAEPWAGEQANAFVFLRHAILYCRARIDYAAFGYFFF